MDNPVKNSIGFATLSTDTVRYMSEYLKEYSDLKKLGFIASRVAAQEVMDSNYWKGRVADQLQVSIPPGIDQNWEQIYRDIQVGLKQQPSRHHGGYNKPGVLVALMKLPKISILEWFSNNNWPVEANFINIVVQAQRYDLILDIVDAVKDLPTYQELDSPISSYYFWQCIGTDCPLRILVGLISRGVAFEDSDVQSYITSIGASSLNTLQILERTVLVETSDPRVDLDKISDYIRGAIKADNLVQLGYYARVHTEEFPDIKRNVEAWISAIGPKLSKVLLSVFTKAEILEYLTRKLHVMQDYVYPNFYAAIVEDPRMTTDDIIEYFLPSVTSIANNSRLEVIDITSLMDKLKLSSEIFVDPRVSKHLSNTAISSLLSRYVPYSNDPAGIFFQVLSLIDFTSSITGSREGLSIRELQERVPFMFTDEVLFAELEKVGRNDIVALLRTHSTFRNTLNLRGAG